MGDIICKWRVASVSTLMELVKELPKVEMNETDFRTAMNNSSYKESFNRTVYQLACQLGLYYIDNDRYIPRFSNDIDEATAQNHLEKWVWRYYVPNPYTKSFGDNVTSRFVLKSIIEYHETHPNDDITQVCSKIWREECGNISAFKAAINGFSRAVKIDKNNRIEVDDNYKEIMNEIFNRDDKKKFFDTISGISLKKHKTPPLPLQQIFYGAPGTGKSHAVKERTEGETVIRTTFHPDSDYSTFVGAYKPTMTDGTWAERILSKDELTQELKSFRDSGITYESVKFGAKYSSSLSKLNSGYYRDMLNICDIPESKSVEIANGMEAGQYLKAEFSKNSKIAYSFVAQAFLQAYVAAWRRRVSDAEDRAVYLVIEEINRGNCAQIFGDLFQLLDRDDSGFSEYPVTADADMRKYLGKELAGLSGENLEGVLPDDIIGKVLAGELLLLPDNMYIWATMNTSDQSLFPIDSAFKRRWDWTYIPIENADKGWKIAVGSERYDWWDFLQKINDRIGETTSSEDKKLGYFFCKAKDGMISADTFVSKVVFYLWNDVFKDYDPDESIFSDGKQGILTFNKFYEGFGKVNDNAVRMMLTNLKVAEESGEKNTGDGQAEVAVETK